MGSLGRRWGRRGVEEGVRGVKLELGTAISIPGLRSWRLTGFPLLWFYFERDTQLDVVRLLGERQDIATILTEAL